MAYDLTIWAVGCTVISHQRRKKKGGPEGTRMSRIVMAVVIPVFIIEWMGFCTVAKGQAVSMRSGAVFEEGLFTVGEKFVEAKSDVAVSINYDGLARGLSGVSNGAFACTPIYPLKNGDTVAADISDYESWSRKHAPLKIGTEELRLPVLGMVADRHKDPDGKEWFTMATVFPMVCNAKVNIKAGAAVHLGGYVIQTSRSLKAGDPIPAVCVDGDAILSVGAANEARPWFTAFPDGADSDDHSRALMAWGKEKHAP